MTNVGALALFFLAQLQGGMMAKAAKPLERELVAVVSFSVDEYDPSKPAGAMMKCVVRNKSRYPAQVPVGFDDNYVQVHSGQLSLRRAKPSREGVRLEWLEPDHELVIFELPLGEILSGDAGRPWRWDWARRPEPPISPIHNYRKPGFGDRAAFIASLNLGRNTLNSEAAVLAVKAGEPR
ncbi:MAG: hypothetical protein U0800_26870 [Isosphaeraceae bacterium]